MEGEGEQEQVETWAAFFFFDRDGCTVPEDKSWLSLDMLYSDLLHCALYSAVLA